MKDRIRASALTAEGEDSPESADDLLSELAGLCDELQALVARINHTNAESRLANDETVTEALARRDVIGLRQAGLRVAVDAANDRGPFSIRRSDARMVRRVVVKDLQAQIDTLARERRDLDVLLQQHNWTAPLTG
jgi:hypothetical protein